MSKYETYEMKILQFGKEDAYVRAWVSDGEEGEDQYSIRPESSDI